MHGSGFQHEALVYDGADGFLSAAAGFIREGLDAGEPVHVAVGAPKIRRLRAGLGEDAERVTFSDMAELGRNPARIIPAWQQFLVDHADRAGGIRGIGEPMWPGRSLDETLEVQLHEALINLAFARADGFRLLCAYDAAALDGAVLREAACSHPAIVAGGRRGASPAYRGDELLAPFDAPLPHPAQPCEVLGFERHELDDVRRLVGRRASATGMPRAAREDLVLAANEAATNSVLHGGGRGVVRVWAERDSVVCETRDRGHITDPLVGRFKPRRDEIGGWGVWLMNQVCDLVQLRSGPDGTAVRLTMRLG